MKIGIMGSGGVGGYFGARLVAAGHDVSFIARGDHLAAMQTRGLTLVSDIGDAHFDHIDATDSPQDVGEVDVVLFAVKLYDTVSAARLVAPMVGPDTVVISLANGIDSENIIAQEMGPSAVAGGVARISASIREPGVIAQHGEFASLEFGELDGRDSPRLDAFAEVCRKAGIRARVSPEIVVAIWRKFCFLASFAAITSLTRLAFGPIRHCPPTFELFQRAVREVLALASARNIELGADEFDKVMQIAAQMGPGIKASMLVDLERGKPIEVEWLSGAVSRLGRELSVPTPVHDMVFAALLPHVQGRVDVA